jgi:hypothetical protein
LNKDNPVKRDASDTTSFFPRIQDTVFAKLRTFSASSPDFGLKIPKTPSPCKKTRSLYVQENDSVNVEVGLSV